MSTEIILTETAETETTETEAAENLLYAFDSQEMVVEFPFSNTRVAHKFRRPAKSIRMGNRNINEYTEWAKLIKYESARADKDNDRIITDNAVADQWLWDRIATHIKGYPGLGEDWVQVTPEIAKKQRGPHKEHAINLLYEGRAKIVDEKTKLTFDGGIWCVELEIGPKDSPTHIIEFYLREWDEKERRKFKLNSSSVLASRDTSKQVLSITTNPSAAEELFDATFDSCDGGTVNDQPFTNQRQEFIEAIDPFWKQKVIAVLTARWNGQNQD